MCTPPATTFPILYSENRRLKNTTLLLLLELLFKQDFHFVYYFLNPFSLHNCVLVCLIRAICLIAHAVLKNIIAYLAVD